MILKCQVTPMRPCKEVKNISLFCICIAALQHAKKIIGKWVWSVQRGGSSRPDLHKMRRKLFFIKRLVQGLFVLLFPRDKGHKAHIKQPTVATTIRWSDFFIFFPARRRQNDPWVRFVSTQAFQQRWPLVMAGHTGNCWTSFLSSC